jgi:quercetin dioxygenase-like cupin family protein
MPDLTPLLIPRLVPHFGGERIDVHDGWLSFVAVGEQTGGAYALIETANKPSKGGPLHIHEREDETWFVLEGEFVFQVGDQTFRAHAGDYVFGPRNVPHRYANQTSAVARALIMVTPAGFEGFWRESARLGSDAPASAHEALGREYGVRHAPGPIPASNAYR